MIARALARVVLRLAGWRIAGALPAERRYLIVVAPHTSNWDFPLAVAARTALGLRASWLGKHTLFRGPLGPVMRWLGGDPVDRDAPGGTVDTAIAHFAARESYVLAIAPEGTRTRVATWRTGFQRIAAGASVPIVPVSLDYGTRTVGLGPALRTSDDAAADIARVRAFYHAGMARDPRRFVPAGPAAGVPR